MSTQINWKNPLTKGLVSLVNGVEPNYESVTKRFAAVHTLERYVQPHVGARATGFSGSTRFDNVFETSDFGSEATMFVLCRPDNNFIHSNNPGRMLMIGTQRDYPMMHLGWDSVDTLFECRSQYNFREIVQSPIGSAPANRTYSVLGTTDGSTIRLFIDGQRSATDTSPEGPLDHKDTRLTIGNSDQFVDRGFAGSIFVSAVWNRSLSDGEAKSLYENPWQLFKPQRMFVPVFPYDVQAQLVGETLTITLVDEAGTAVPNLTGLSWAWFDQSTVDAALAPIDQGTGETTDGSGVLEISLPNTTLTTGGTGMLALRDSTGYIYAWYRVTL